MLQPIINQFGSDRVHFDLIIGIAASPMGIGLYIMVEVGKVPFVRGAIAV